jgi:predicted SAM-dependent methyltransferase
MSNGVIYYNKGNSCVIRLITSIYSLRKYYDGPVTVFVESCSIDDIKYFFENNHIDIVKVDNPENNSAYIRKIEISQLSPYINTVFIDADTVVLGNINELFDHASEHDMCVTKFAGWSSSGRTISKRIRSFEKYISEEMIKNAISYGPAINTGIYAFNKNSKIFDEWSKLAKIGQSNSLYIPDEVACQILLPQYNVKVLDEIYNTSVRFGKVDNKNKIIHYHGRKHCKAFSLCEHWIKEFIEVATKYKDHTNIKNFVSYDRSLRRFLMKKYGWGNYVDSYNKLFNNAKIIENNIPYENNVTIVTACDTKYIEFLKLTLPTWIKYKNILQFPMIVYINGFEDNDKRLAFLREHKNIKLIHWDMHNVDSQREKMLSVFVYGPARDVKTKYWMKIDADTYAVNNKALLSNDMYNYDIVGHKWNYTKPYNWVEVLNKWSTNSTDLDFVFDIETKHIKRNKYYHQRTASYVQLHSTEFTKVAARIAGQRLPIPSHDTYFWYIAAALKKRVLRYNFKRNGGMYTRRTSDQLKNEIRTTNENDKKNTFIKLHIGCGKKHYDGWINTNKNTLDITNYQHWIDNKLSHNSIDRILAEYVFQHLSEKDIKLGIENFKKFIKPNGIIRIAVPDGNRKFYDKGEKSDRFCYNYESLTNLFSQYGFKYRLLEYFDKDGTFCFNEWSPEDGYIKRSSRYDRRNRKNKLTYTSLIVDFYLS